MTIASASDEAYTSVSVALDHAVYMAPAQIAAAVAAPNAKRSSVLDASHRNTSTADIAAADAVATAENRLRPIA